MHLEKMMTSRNRTVPGADDNTTLPPPGPEMVGAFRRNRRGFGFVIPDSPNEHGDLYVPPRNTGTALTGDRVRARVMHQPGRGRSPYIGLVIEIIQRANKHFAGTLQRQLDSWVVRVDGRLLHEPVIVRDPHAKNAKDGDKVVVELIEYPTDEEPAEGVIIEVLGEAGLPDVETVAVMRAHGLEERFPATVLEDASRVIAAWDDTTIPADRQDLTAQLICTIDPPDARDFDDAISIDKLDVGVQDDGALYELGVHIADVSSFVRPAGVLDQEAAARGNSVYLPRRVIPMLPEVLSNGVCSLQEGVNRFCKSVFIRYDAHGGVVGQRLVNSVIRSAKRLSYLEAQALIDGDLQQARRHAAAEPRYPSALIGTLKLMDELAKVLRRRRLDEGMIVLDLPEVELVFDQQGYVIDAVPEDDAFTHKIIEMFMVEANEAVARLFNGLGVPILRRVHPDPDAPDLKDLRMFAQVAGFQIPARPTRPQLQALLDAVRGKPAQRAIHMAVLKTLAKAEYAPSPIGHFALASEHYTHFTSPIRRYPDLTVHCALQAYLELTTAQTRLTGGRHKQEFRLRMRDDNRCPDEQTLAGLGQHCSATERNAESAERDLRTFLVLQLLSDHLGEDFQGVISGVTPAGVYVQLERYLVDGFVDTADLPAGNQGSDRWRLNRATGALVAQRSGRTITIGDPVTARIVNTNPAGRTMELVIIEPPSPSRPKRRQPKGARQAFASNMQIKRLKKKQRKQER